MIRIVALRNVLYGGAHDLELLQPLPEQLHLLVAVDVLHLEVLVLVLELAQLVRHPVLDPRGLGLDLLGVREAELALEKWGVLGFTFRSRRGISIRESSGKINQL